MPFRPTTAAPPSLRSVLSRLTGAAMAAGAQAASGQGQPKNQDKTHQTLFKMALAQEDLAQQVGRQRDRGSDPSWLLLHGGARNHAA